MYINKYFRKPIYHLFIPVAIAGIQHNGLAKRTCWVYK